jgi:hypothetical protein
VQLIETLLIPTLSSSKISKAQAIKLFRSLGVRLTLPAWGVRRLRTASHAKCRRRRRQGAPSLWGDYAVGKVN